MVGLGVLNTGPVSSMEAYMYTMASIALMVGLGVLNTGPVSSMEAYMYTMALLVLWSI